MPETTEAREEQCETTWQVPEPRMSTQWMPGRVACVQAVNENSWKEATPGNTDYSHRDVERAGCCRCRG